MAKYNIEEIEHMKMSGMTLTEISGKLGTSKSALSKYLSRHGKPFSSLKKKCKYCGKLFTPNKYLNGDYCSETCYTFSQSEKAGERMYKHHKKYGDNTLDLNINNANVSYENSLYLLNCKKESVVCELCGNDDENEFEICRGEIVCRKCGLVVG